MPPRVGELTKKKKIVACKYTCECGNSVTIQPPGRICRGIKDEIVAFGVTQYLCVYDGRMMKCEHIWEDIK